MKKKRLRNIKIIIEYDGTDFYGWQVQPGFRTVQEEIEKALTKLTGEKRRVFASGRTDAGVHALGQAAHFFTASSIPGKNFAMALNAYLSNDIAVLSSREVNPSFHARKSAKGKHYRYLIYNRKIASPIKRRYMHCVYEKLNIDQMREAAKHLIGRKNFASFASNAKRKDNPVRLIKEISIKKKGAIITIDVIGESFLYKMVRCIAGTLVEIGRGKALNIKSILESKKRIYSGPNLPPNGLYLVKVFY